MDFDRHVLINAWPLLVKGLGVTLAITFISLAIGIGLALVVCAARLARHRVIIWTARGYIEFFRTTPELVLIFWVYFCLPPIFDLRLSALTSGVLALSLVCGAFMAEIFRAGILAVPQGQIEAAHALAIPALHRWCTIVLPQAMRRMMPAFVNYFTELVKNSTLLAAIGAGELAYQAYTEGAKTFRYMELLSAIGILFFVVIFPLSMYARRAEAKTLSRTGQ